MQQFFNLIRKISSKTTQFVLGTLSIFWGIWILLPLETFEASVGFNPLASIVHEWSWGIFLIALGVATMVTVSDKFFRYQLYSFLLSGVHLLFWGFVFTSFLLFTPASASVPTYFTILLTAFLNYVKLYVEEDNNLR